MEKIIYVSDLDGILLHSNEQISEYSCKVLNDLVDRGMIFSYATARSAITSQKVTKGLNAKIPLIVYNGAFILSNETKKRLMTNVFLDEQKNNIWEMLRDYEVFPIVYSLINGKEKYSYLSYKVNSGMKLFLDSRKNDIRDNPLDNMKEIITGKIFYFTCIDSEKKLLPLYEALKNKYYCVYQKDIYTKEQWLEIMPQSATKANAILQLKKMYNCDKIISFGDGKNDIPMFEISDECYAVDNADSELKKIATGIIESNNNDGVVKWLLNNAKF
ncbi:HAD-IIB family hydrolase [Clostridium guangxiense]|uniref:HAD-IIB family hydrolase n=1 Tax=Clostridium guangxiense TaxID=1662055 RepID=UPI001E597081|nr:HAD-IIB family hydrolase [Clostridium guangxiense]MCD2346151.1 HAD family hydrolase [Clostridium guangxiense]